MALIVALPFFTAVTLPLLTFATFAFELDHFAFLLVPVTLSVTFWPGYRVAFALFIFTAAAWTERLIVNTITTISKSVESFFHIFLLIMLLLR